ncbi:MAG TPA: hypothetical protein VFF13_04980 [archaeon]|nr:hypothetical protein [archaeon]
MKLNIELLGSSFYYTLNRVALKLFEVLSLWLLVKLLPKEQIAFIGIAMGFIALLNILNILPYRRIFKSFEEVNKRFSDHLSSYIVFWFLQSTLMLGIALITAFFYVQSGFAQEIFLVMTGLSIAFLFGNLQLLFQEMFFVKLKQKTATIFNLISMVVFLGSLALLLFYPSIELYVSLIILKAVLTCAGFFLLSKKEIGFVFRIASDWKKLLKDALAEFAVFDHLIGAFIEIITKSYLFVLGFFVAYTIAPDYYTIVIADYTIALLMVNLLTFFPLIIYRVSMLAMTRVSTKEGLEKVLSAFTKYSAIFSLVQLVIFAALLNPLLSFFTDGNIGNSELFALVLGIGTTVFNIGLPIHATAVLKSSIADYFKKIIFPVTLLSVAAYFFVSAFFEPVWIGIVYIFAAVAVNALAYLHVKRNVGISLQKVFFYAEEKEAIDHVLEKLGLKKEIRK